jgi:hypothetical protein
MGRHDGLHSFRQTALFSRAVVIFLQHPAWLHAGRRVAMCYPVASERLTAGRIHMRDIDKAAKVIEALKTAEHAPAPIALPILNGLVGLVQAEGEQPLEIEEARASAFLAICEVAKALHRGQPADRLWVAAIAAGERWMALAR